MTVSMTQEQYLRRECSHVGRARIRLRRSEAEILYMLVTRRGEIVPRAELLCRLYPSEDGGPLGAPQRLSLILRDLRSIMPDEPLVTHHWRGISLDREVVQ
jgi:DNA-binding winged helix-turn-helix (wHTH) protein